MGGLRKDFDYSLIILVSIECQHGPTYSVHPKVVLNMIQFNRHYDNTL